VNAAIMAVKVEDGEYNTTGFLDTPETEKWPFAVELVERLALRAEGVCDLTLTSVIALRRAIP